ncbi:MAG: DNA mismatch repair protein MutS [Ruminococcaceae bacterium]|nr:DNA mismatch repair protein MutS [Oscillospiraceae bacterium]
MALSPLMKQYLEVKQEHPDCILMCRIGDFYEMFFEDAKTASRELDLVLTGKDCGLEERAPMCGVPHHAVEGYIAKLVSRGYRVAICEQMEDPATAKGLVKRDVVRIITPGTVTEGGYLDEKKNNYICAAYSDNFGCGVAFADVSTGQITATEIMGENLPARVLSEAAAYMPSELIVPESFSKDISSLFSARFNTLVSMGEEESFTVANSVSAIKEIYGESPATDSDYSVRAVGGLVAYIRRTQKIDLTYLQKINFYSCDEFMGIDSASRRNLEISESMRAHQRKGSLLWAVDRTRTSAGARLLRRHLEKPLVNETAIKARLDAVSELYSDGILRDDIRELLKGITDIERLTTRLVYGTANARDLKSLEKTVRLFPQIKELLEKAKTNSLKRVNCDIDSLTEIADAIGDTISEEPALTLKEGGIIRRGCNAAVDELYDLVTNGKAWIARIEEIEREKTGIKTLKVGYNRVFGYYIEVSKSFLPQVPDHYIRRQTLTNGERFVTPELKETESRVIGARDRLYALEYELFVALRDFVLKSLEKIKTAASALAELDVYCSNAEIAREQGYVCPEIDRTDKISIKNCRHPVVERFLEGNYFVPNDCVLDCGANRMMLITGPNMAGKSTYMRQIALCVILAQAGCFVPATEARIGIVDRVFTRVGASDDLASGNSTFMLEMNEVADILKNATKNSLIIYDEIGRGTSTYDGMSIARAVVEYTSKKIGAKTLFATHYHELTELEGETDGVVNYNIAAKKRGNDVVFLRKIIKGAADDSYGIEVAHLAGVPETVVNRAKQILASLDQQQARPVNSVKNESDNITFEALGESRVIDKLKNLDINTLTPYEAISVLYELKKELE